MPAEEILRHMQNKEVGDVDAVQGSKRGDYLTHAKQVGWGCGGSSRFNKKEELSYYGYK